jgi:AraC-like DNA-binding protein
LLASPLPGAAGVGGVVTAHLRALAAARLTPAESDRLGAVTLDLLAVLLAGDAVAVESRERALVARVEAYVEAHLGDPDLDPERIAAAHHVSVRTLHRLFQGRDASVAAWVRDRRLDRCRRDLVDPRRRGETVRAVATRWGFPDAAHFSRAFRAAYGVAPRDVRP